MNDETISALRSLPAEEISGCLHSLVGVVPSKETEPPAIEGSTEMVDALAWIAWSLGGIRACTVPAGDVATGQHGQQRRRPWTPTLRDVVDEAQRFALTLAARRYQGNISRAAKALGVSRRTLREAAKRLGVYQAFVEQGVKRRLAASDGGEA